MAALAAGTLHRHSRVKVLSANRVEIAGPAGEPVQGDGDVIVHLPAIFESLPDAARLVGP
jgi:diacylglycerol kinase family enzyme